MDEAKIEELRLRLLAEKEQLLGELTLLERESAETTRDQNDEGATDDDVASDLYEEERIKREESEVKTHLQEIEEALRRIANGTYGFSKFSGKPIPLERLEALPWATYLVEEERLVR